MAHAVKCLLVGLVAGLLALAPIAALAQPPKPAYVTGSITTGAVAKASGAQSFTTGDFTGDCTTSGTLSLTCTKLNGVSPGYFFSGTDAANLTGTVACARLPALTGDVTTSAGSCATTIGAHKVVLGDIAQIAANKLLGNVTGSTADIAAVSLTDCHGTGNAVTYTAGTGFGCTTISGGTPGGSSGQIQYNNAGAFGGFTASGDATINTSTGAVAVTKTGGVAFGTFATQNYATPPAIGGTTPAAGTFTSLTATGNLTTNVTGSTQCVQANSSGVLSGSGGACGGTGATISGTPTAGNCTSWLNSTTIQDAGAACGSGGSSAFPLTIVQEAAFASTTNSGSFSVTFPQTAASSGNTLFMIVSADGSQTFTAPTGWTIDFNVAQATYARIVLLHKSSASDTGATFTAGSVTSWGVQFFEVSGSHALDVSSTGGIANAATIPMPAITPTAGSAVFAVAAIVPNTISLSTSPVNPAWQPIGMPTYFATGRVFVGHRLTTPAAHVSTKPPAISIPSIQLFAGGGIAYATFSIL
jgi:hypothetical protein